MPAPACLQRTPSHADKGPPTVGHSMPITLRSHGRANREHGSSLCPPQGVHGLLLHLDDDIEIVFYQRQHLLPRPQPPIGAPVIGVLPSLSVVEAFKGTDNVVRVFVM